jgi:hypothetical protein
MFVHGSSADVSDVMINGNFYVRKGILLTSSEEELLGEGKKLMSKLLDQAVDKPPMKVAEQAPAPVIQLEPAPSTHEDDEVFEEGFRVVKNGNAVQEEQGNIIPIKIEEPKKVEMSKTIAKVFGEDDL